MSLSHGGSSTPYILVPMGDPSRVGEARRAVAALTARAGFDSVAAGKVALAVNELGSNLLKHAREGKLLVGVRQRGAALAVEVVSIDAGPGMTNTAACQRDGYSSSGTSGNGLGAVQRLADEFDIHSMPGRGTAILARFHASQAGSAGDSAAARHGGVDYGGISIAAPGEEVCGDGWAVALDDGVVSAMVVDGLGHGAGAAEAAQASLTVFGAARQAGPARFIEKAHAALRATRGAACAMATLDPAHGQIRFAGAGNVVARVVSGIAEKTLLTQNGTVGIQIRSVQEQAMAWPEHALVVMFTDGIVSRWQLDDPGLLTRDPSLIAAWLIGNFCRGRDDATVVVLRRTRE